MAVRDEILAANELYAGAFDKGGLPMPPGRRFAVVTCMDARLDPAQFLGLEEGDAHVIRNAGGLVTDDALRSLAISHHLLGTEQAFVIAHTDCGMLTFTNEQIRERIGTPAESVDFLAFGDVEQSVRASVQRIADSQLLPDSFEAQGFVYDVRSGQLAPVTARREAETTA
jgi:carbonic anhydrase